MSTKTSTQTYLLEIGTEEMPSAPLIHAEKELGDLMDAALTKAGLSHGSVQTYSTPRRLAVVVADVAEATQEIHEQLRGPAKNIAFKEDGSPAPAALGFAKKCGVEPTALELKQDADGKEYVYATRFEPARLAAELLGELSHDIIASLTWPNYRSQRWGFEHESFVRPIRWICALFGDKPIEVRYADVISSNTTQGHRVLAPGAHTVPSADAYVDTCHAAYVFFAPERRETILKGVDKITQSLGEVSVDMPAGTFSEVVNLVEYPTVLKADFDEEFLSVPQEIICDSMLSNQRYFPVLTQDGKLTRHFILVSNSSPANNERVIDGNERVVRARLDDAKFFYEEDLKHPLEYYVDQLADVVFQEKLGTVYQKTQRMVTIAAAFMQQATADEAMIELAKRAAFLAKADLVTQAVIEFTKQQGVMGGYYAAAAGEDPQVCTAIKEHYMPRFAGDDVPTGIVGKAVALADKLDTVCGMFVIGEPPTGSSDPFAVRRSALGVIAILRTVPQVALKPLIAACLEAYAAQGLQFRVDEVEHAIEDFFVGRLVHLAKEEHIKPDTTQAIASIGVIDPQEFLDRAHALDDARDNAREVFDDLASAYARAAHISDESLGTTIDEQLLVSASQALLEACTQGEICVDKALAAKDYKGAYAALASLKEPIDIFFDEVLVMDDNEKVRVNNLRLLNRFVATFAHVANISALSKAK